MFIALKTNSSSYLREYLRPKVRPIFCGQMLCCQTRDATACWAGEGLIIGCGFIMRPLWSFTLRILTFSKLQSGGRLVKPIGEIRTTLRTCYG